MHPETLHQIKFAERGFPPLPYYQNYVQQTPDSAAEARRLQTVIDRDCVVTSGSTGGIAASGKHCRFPFVYRGKRYEGCTDVDSPGKKWCYVNQDQIADEWGYCSVKCPTSTGVPDSSPQFPRSNFPESGTAPTPASPNPTATPTPVPAPTTNYDGGALTRENTAPIKIIANYDLLDEDKVEKYRMCFKIGEWFKIGGIDTADGPPADGKPTCSKLGDSRCTGANCIATTNVHQGCWGKCGVKDTLTEATKACMKRESEAVIPFVSKFLRVAQLAGGNLKLTRSEGSYPSYYQSIGVPPGPTCFADCKHLHDMRYLKKMPDTYCDDGVPADHIVFISKPPADDGIAGWGGSCGQDQYEGSYS